MKSTNRTQVTKDFIEKSILVSRVFNAPIEKVWQAHSEGNYWLYAMVSPENQRQLGLMGAFRQNHATKRI